MAEREAPKGGLLVFFGMIAAVVAIGAITNLEARISALQAENAALRSEMSDQASLFKEMTTPDRPPDRLDPDSSTPALQPK